MSELAACEGAGLAGRWSGALERLRIRTGDAAFDSWLRHIVAGRLSDGVVELFVPPRFMKNLVSQNYGKDILEALSCEGVEAREVRFLVQSAASSFAQAASHVRGRFEEPAADAARAGDGGSSLDPRLTFANFVVGKSNEFAAAAARRLAASAGRAPFNPLFFYSGVGLGKMHLMQAIAWEMRASSPSKSIVYLSAERFMKRYVHAMKARSMDDFNDRFRSADVLLIDDVQFLVGKNKTQEEFFHTFNALMDRGGQLVLAADRAPMLLEGIEERLQSRMTGGLVADIMPTTYELRFDILKLKARNLGIQLQTEVLEFLAQRIASNVRELEGALLRLVAHADLMREEVTVRRAEEVLRDVLGMTARRLTLDEIQRKVAEHFKVSPADILSPRRDRDIARPRQVAMYLAKQLTTRSLPEIGRKFNRDHTTVIHAVRTIETLVARDNAMARDVDALKKSLA